MNCILTNKRPKSSGDLDGTPMMFRPITEGRKEASGRALERGDVHADQRDCNTYSAQVDRCFVCLFTIIQSEAKNLKTSIEILFI